ncbi:uncharacterized protein N7482_001805 [Penicillium canariense]|uniref:HAUS augmin-like complex subunit 6 N-terminal domain-containing protein n=1 Tax=Penicillium canariense TaxID=189055 RepID=A0A9W9IE30_9EURO|nr:uncharacterized protein N7482_001805 [Penicillium canariense]KAJ5175928.1 hypothetical protein N7482_001805 [Penicillium canariense]
MAASRPARPKPLEWSGPSHITVFIRNLKLLHLDQREDWPDITTRALSSSSQNQRQRIRLIEWSLYYLFMIWDPEGAHNVRTHNWSGKLCNKMLMSTQKLRPFFPPLEPLQSVNLRAALFRALTELKKNGDLGRETILRKSMLDDCKGEKFDELLAVFSTAVLRKLVAVSASEMLWNPAMTLSTASSVSATDYQNLLPLILAHQISLDATGAHRTRVQETYEQFSRLLDDKKAELADRANKLSAQNQDPVQTDSDRLVREVQTNWLGSEEWATAVLYGGSRSSTDAFLELPFSRAWKQATQSTVGALSSGVKSDLVVDLEAQVLRLRSRLRRWHEFKDDLRKERDRNGDAAGAEFQAHHLSFRDHQSLTVASISKAVRESADCGRALKRADRSFMSSVNEALTRINGKPHVDKPQPPSLEFTKIESPPVSAEISDPQPTKLLMSEDAQASVFSTYDSPDKPPEPQAEPLHSSPPIVRLSPDQHSEPEDHADPEPLKPPTSNYTLVERTRKSMSLIPPPTHEPQSRPRRRGARPSFPVSQFETPRKASRPGITRSSTPQDKLFEEDADYASVFKSRPRVAHSPISSPAVHISPSMDEDEEFDLEYDEADLRDMDSPLLSTRFRG